ncbi:pilus assembly protein [Shewanella sp. SG41-3]|uniref:pilus assembly protein n=1 Tax=Shewanella sp. SG41-3 TaxID=2760977 RepID=UPI0015FF16FC|nr:PilC/PilY family type IV pilus protein [Shewanella sp. SG41-3]MBB1474287.1 rRNA (guanine-N1)-methyltransferase [Shewanella sp. SG41-3]
MIFKQLQSALLFAILVYSSISFADDTELYVFEASARSGARPQVLIIFDTSGSMGNNFYTEDSYPRGNEDVNNSGTKLTNNTNLFYTRSSTNIPTSASKQTFKNSVNMCATSQEYLINYGMFTGFLREHRYTGESGAWEELPLTDGSAVSIIDCYEDIAEQSYKNPGVQNGFPVDGLGTSAAPVMYTPINNSSTQSEIDDAIAKSKLTNFGIGQPITIYTEKYINWYNSTKSKHNYSRMSVAQRVIEDTIVTTPGVDFGLSVFNYNSNNRNGGRIVYGISTTTNATKERLLTTISSLSPGGNTPLCENLYEAYRYFAGGGVYYGNDDPTRIPLRDTTIEVNGKYTSPFVGKQCQNDAYIIYVTDGEPTSDTDADSEVLKLSGLKTSDRYASNYLPALAGWMHKNDVNPNITGDQLITTYTIGFSDGADSAAPILKETAKRGGGDYYSAKSAQALQGALQKIFSNILEVNSSFTSPSIASNNFDRTQSLDSVYYAMFLPNKGPRWLGNLKKFKVTKSGDIVDKNGNPALDATGSLKNSACSYWTLQSICDATSSGGDGNNVDIGGASSVLQVTANRKLLGNFGSGGALTDFTKNTAINIPNIGNEDKLALFMGVDKTELSGLFDWAKGVDVDDEDSDGSKIDKRVDIMGDPLHSKPLAINYGTAGSPDLRIIVGTNAGFVHMFKDAGDTVTESWGFMPYELLPNLRELRANVPTGVHSVYGMDTPPVTYVKRSASGAIQKAYLFIGMRRGGQSYYALDITNPDSPSFKWKIDSSSAGMAELGQTWAEPIVTFIPGVPSGNTSASTASPVLIFGAGYSPSTKDSSAVGSDDTKGRGVFIVNADTGALVHQFGPASGTGMTKMAGIVDSIPNSVAVLDSNNDRLTDRIYATDTGANIWRMDLPTANPSDSTNPWTAFKFASLGGDTPATDRRFFAEPTVVQTYFNNISEVTSTVSGVTTKTNAYQKIAYDAVVVGSGHRPHPLDKARNDKFFVLQDRNILTKSFTGATGKEIPAALTINDLYDVTTTPPSTEAQNIAFGTKRGWYYSFPGTGEKSLSAGTIIQGRVFFTSYEPGTAQSTNQCLVTGQGRIYGFDLHKGTRSYSQTSYETGYTIPDTPQVIIPPHSSSEDGYMYLVGAGSELFVKLKPGPDDGCADGDNKCVRGGLKVNKIYYHIDE